MIVTDQWKSLKSRNIAQWKILYLEQQEIWQIQPKLAPDLKLGKLISMPWTKYLKYSKFRIFEKFIRYLISDRKEFESKTRLATEKYNLACSDNS